jgi:hypothetical protein
MNKQEHAKQTIARIDEFVNTARAVKGDHFADFVLFLVDMSQLIHVNRLLANFCMEHGAEDRVEAVQFLTQAILTQATTRLSETLNLSVEDTQEAIVLCDKIVDSLKTP